MSTSHGIGREIGTALAVLALYLLTLLAPLHEARAGQLALEKLGYATTEVRWVLCTAGGVDSSDDMGVAKCPATGPGKDGLAPPLLDALPVRHDVIFVAADPGASPAPAPRLVASPSGPRAPPLPV